MKTLNMLVLGIFVYPGTEKRGCFEGKRVNVGDAYMVRKS
jgi:hypothetical protein